jgi:ankyrin repeat protein
MAMATVKPRDLGSLPPEMVLRIAGFLDQPSLCSLVRAARFLHVLLWEVLYRRDVQHNSAGLIRCIRAGAITAVTKFLAVGADINAKVDMSPDIEDFIGCTFPLATAVVRSQKEIIRLLLDRGADVGAWIEGDLCYSVLDHTWAAAHPNTALSVAIALGHTDIAVDLVQKLPDPNAIVSTLYKTDYSALEQAALCLNPDVVRELLRRGADPNRSAQRGNLPILHALLGNHNLPYWVSKMPDGERLITETVMALLEYGADPFVKSHCPGHIVDWDDDEAEVCKCGLTACAMGSMSSYPRLRRHFGDLLHRQRCHKLTCRASRHDYGTVREDIPGHCTVRF